ncbi:branched-chain amino acid transport domain protein, partial [Escherichia coli 1.2264]
MAAVLTASARQSVKSLAYCWQHGRLTKAGERTSWTAAFGFLITAVGLPVLTVVALAKVGGGVDSLSTPIGKVAGVLLAT